MAVKHRKKSGEKRDPINENINEIVTSDPRETEKIATQNEEEEEEDVTAVDAPETRFSNAAESTNLSEDKVPPTNNSLDASLEAHHGQSSSDLEVVVKTKQTSTSPSFSTTRQGVMAALGCLALAVLTPFLLQKWNSQSDNNSGTSKHGSNPSSHRKNSELSPSAQQPLFPCTEDVLSNYWHDHPVPGMHMVCLEPMVFNQVNFTFYKGSVRQVSSQITASLPLPWVETLEPLLQAQLDLPAVGSSPAQPWAVFSPNGVRLVTAGGGGTTETNNIGQIAASIIQQGLVLVFQGGQFVWPGVRIGFLRTIDLYSTMPSSSSQHDLAIHTSSSSSTKPTTATLETLSLSPLILSVKGFLSTDECDHIRAKASPSMRYSEVVLMDHDAGRPASDFRTSQTTFLHSDRDDIFVDLDYRTASLVRVPRNHQEPVQVLRYGRGEKYSAHADYFEAALYRNDANTQQLIKGGVRNRMSTVFWYLTDVEAGGETVFPRFNGSQESSMDDCDNGLKVKPERGKVIIFYSMKPDGTEDPASLHGACPVKDGIKWAANKVRILTVDSTGWGERLLTPTNWSHISMASGIFSGYGMNQWDIHHHEYRSFLKISMKGTYSSFAEVAIQSFACRGVTIQPSVGSYYVQQINHNLN